MRTVGIICEYNPLHRGHTHQLAALRREEDTVIICLMSGNYVQRGAPAIFDKSLRAKAAVACGADLVLELPIGAALSSAEGFAAQGVAILSRYCDGLSFGVESMDAAALLSTAQALLSEDFPTLLRAQLDTGISFPAARQRALSALGCPQEGLALPNNLLAVEYCKAILSQNASLELLPIPRSGDYHAQTLGTALPSATAVRKSILEGGDWLEAIPVNARPIFASAPVHTLEAGERAMLSKLRTMSDRDFEALPFGSEGLWRKLMKASRREASLEAIAEATKSKRYTRTRIDRMLLCAFLGLTADDLTTPAPYVRALAFNDRGRAILRSHPEIRNAGEPIDHPYWDLECRLGSLYGLFSTGTPEPPQLEEKRRIQYHKVTIQSP